MSSGREAIQGAVGRIVRAEARNNELRIAIVRLAAYALILVLDVWFWLAGTRPLGNFLYSGMVVVVSALLLVGVQRLPVLPGGWLVIPLLDMAFIYRILVGRIEQQGLTTGLAATTALACALFAATGAIRFERQAALWNTALATILFYALVDDRLVGTPMVYCVVGLAAVGLFVMWLTDIVRRSLEAARGREFLSRFLPAELLEKAFADPLGALAEPRSIECTVVVTDLRGFTSLAEHLAPAEVFAFLNRVQGALARAVHDAGGVVDKFMGDGMLAVFGAPEPRADHARCALQAVRAILRAVDELNASLPPERRFRIGVGVHSGSVVAGCLGGSERLEFTVIGDAVNTASRLESLTKEKGVPVLVSQTTFKLSGDPGLTSLGPVAIRGRSQTLDVFALA